jgi:hypothetical protein
MTHASTRRPIAARALALAAGALLATPLVAQAPAASTDPRVGLRGGWRDAEQAIRGLTLVSHTDRPAGFFTPGEPGSFTTANSDLAFKGDLVFVGNFGGFQIWDASDPKAPKLRAAVTCPGGQGDVSVHGTLLFMSVEETKGRVDCGTQGIQDTVSTDRFRGVRIFDITDVSAPKQVGMVQTCRGSHTHTLVPDRTRDDRVFVYVSGTGPVRSPNELAGCVRGGATDPATSRFSIDVIEVPIANPSAARIVASPRIFADASGKPGGLWMGGNHGQGTQMTSVTDQCHDITVYPAMGLAAGACSGNGILLDISDPANPKRVHEVTDPNFAYWHSATFSNDARTVLFSDEWGGGTSPRCRATDKPLWGADALFTLRDRKMIPAGHYKMPAPQTAAENCVAHNGSLIPIPGRDVMVQAFYQGGLTVFDFTDPRNVREIAFFDRGPVAENLTLGGFWSTYWYNGRIYGSEIARGLDILELQPSDQLSQNEIDAAKTVRWDHFNPQTQTRITWPPSFVLARAYVDQLSRDGGLTAARTTAIMTALQRAEAASGTARRTQLGTLATALGRDARSARDAAKVRTLAGVVRELARS